MAARGGGLVAPRSPPRYGSVMSDLSRRETVVLACAAVASAVLLAVVQWRAGFLMTNDGPQRLYASVVTAGIDDRALGFAPYWRTLPTLTGRSFASLYSLVADWFPWDIAYRLILLLMVELFAWGGFLLVARANPGRGACGLLAFPVAHHWVFYLGLLDFYIAGAIALLAFAHFLPCTSWSVRKAALLALTGIVVVAGHFLPAFFLFVALISCALAQHARRPHLIALAGVPAGIMTCWIYFLGRRGGSSWEWLDWSERALQASTHFIPGPPWRCSVFAVVGIVSSLTALRGSKRDRGLWFARALLFASTLALPYTGSWQYVSPRSLPLAFVCLLASVPVERLHASLRWVLAICSVAWCIAAFGWADDFHTRLRSQSEALLAVLDAGRSGPPEQVRIPLVLTPRSNSEVPEMDPAIHLGQVVGAAWGGFVHYTQIGSIGLHLIEPNPEFVLKTFMPPPVANVFQARNARGPERTRFVAQLAAEAAPADEVLVWGSTEDLQLFEDRGYVARARGPEWIVAHVPRCALRIALEDLSAVSDVTLRTSGASAPSLAWSVAPGSHALALQFPCGRVEIAVAGHTCDGAPRALGHLLPGVETTVSCRAQPQEDETARSE